MEGPSSGGPKPYLVPPCQFPGLNPEDHKQSPPFLQRASPGSAGVDLCASTDTILDADSGTQIIPTGVFGPPPSGTFFLIIGRASSTLQGLIVYPTVVDNDYTGEIQVLAAPSSQPIFITQGQRIAQALPLPLNDHYPALNRERGSSQPGSSDIFWVQQVTQDRPSLKLQLDKRWFSGIVDTGADSTVISKIHWPSSWPLRVSATHLQGIGQSKNTLQSSKLLKWEDSEGHSGTVQPYVIENLPVNLWGRDILSQLGVIMYSPNELVTQQMLRQGHIPGKGLGRNGQ
ncbi:protease-like protein, partial [Leptotrombidium deliense]